MGGGYGKERVSARLLRREAVERLERAKAGLHQLRPGVRLPRQLLGENQAGRKPQDLLPAPCAIAVNRLQKPWRVLVCLCETNWQRGAGYRARHPAEIGRSAKRPRSPSPPLISLICPWLKKVRYPVLVQALPPLGHRMFATGAGAGAPGQYHRGLSHRTLETTFQRRRRPLWRSSARTTNF